MSKMKHCESVSDKLRRFKTDCRGATSIEYGIIVGVMSLGVIAATSLFLDAVGGMWASNASQIQAASD